MDLTKFWDCPKCKTRIYQSILSLDEHDQIIKAHERYHKQKGD